VVLGDTPDSCRDVADKIVQALASPAISVDEKKLELGRQARSEALMTLRRYSRTLEEEDIKRGGIRATV
jgi:hypothetical protein